MAEQDELWIKESKDGKIRIGLSPQGQEAVSYTHLPSPRD